MENKKLNNVIVKWQVECQELTNELWGLGVAVGDEDGVLTESKYEVLRIKLEISNASQPTPITSSYHHLNLCSLTQMFITSYATSSSH